MLVGPRTGVPRTIGQVAPTQLAQEDPRTVGPKDYWALGLLAQSSLEPKNYWARPFVHPSAPPFGYSVRLWVFVILQSASHSVCNGRCLILLPTT